MSGKKFLHTDPVPDTPYAQVTKAAIAIYGGKCEWCGVADVPFEFDHVLGGGDAHRVRERPNAVKRRISAQGERLTDVHLQLLCVECHRSKSGLENGIRRLAERGIHMAFRTRPVSQTVIRNDADSIIKGILG